MPTSRTFLLLVVVCVGFGGGGIPYLVAGSDNYRAPVLLQGVCTRSRPLGGWTDGKKILLWYSRIYQQMQMLFGCRRC